MRSIVFKQIIMGRPDRKKEKAISWNNRKVAWEKAQSHLDLPVNKSEKLWSCRVTEKDSEWLLLPKTTVNSWPEWLNFCAGTHVKARGKHGEQNIIPVGRSKRQNWRANICTVRHTLWRSYKQMHTDAHVHTHTHTEREREGNFKKGSWDF